MGSMVKNMPSCSTGPVPKKAGKKTPLRTLAFIAFDLFTSSRNKKD